MVHIIIYVHQSYGDTKGLIQLQNGTVYPWSIVHRGVNDYVEEDRGDEDLHAWSRRRMILRSRPGGCDDEVMVQVGYM